MNVIIPMAGHTHVFDGISYRLRGTEDSDHIYIGFLVELRAWTGGWHTRNVLSTNVSRIRYLVSHPSLSQTLAIRSYSIKDDKQFVAWNYFTWRKYYQQ